MYQLLPSLEGFADTAKTHIDQITREMYQNYNATAGPDIQDLRNGTFGLSPSAEQFTQQAYIAEQLLLLLQSKLGLVQDVAQAAQDFGLNQSTMFELGRSMPWLFPGLEDNVETAMKTKIQGSRNGVTTKITIPSSKVWKDPFVGIHVNVSKIETVLRNYSTEETQTYFLTQSNHVSKDIADLANETDHLKIAIDQRVATLEGIIKESLTSLKADDFSIRPRLQNMSLTVDAAKSGLAALLTHVQ